MKAYTIEKIAVMCKMASGKSKNKRKWGMSENGSSVLRDFVAGVEPTGTITFDSALHNKDHHARHKAINIVGGAIGGAAIIPGITSAIALGIPRYISAGKGRSVKIISDAATKPYSMLYRGILAMREMSAIAKGKNVEPDNIKRVLSDSSLSNIIKMNPDGGASRPLTSVQRGIIDRRIASARGIATENIKKEYSGHNGQLPVKTLKKIIDKNYTADDLMSEELFKKTIKDTYKDQQRDINSDIVSAIKSDPELRDKAIKTISLGTVGGAGIIALSGATNAMSAMAQYNSGLKARKLLAGTSTQKKD